MPTDQDSGQVVYQLDLTDSTHRYSATRDEVNRFLEAHGINPMLVMIESSLQVWRRNGTLWLHVREAEEGYPLCEHCEGCVKTRPVTVPLTRVPPLLDIPLLDVAYVDPRFSTGEWSWPE